MRNFARMVHDRIRVEGRIGISCEFLKSGDPNLKPKKGLVRPFSAPVRRKSWDSEVIPPSEGGSSRSSLGKGGKVRTNVHPAAASQTARSRSSKSTEREEFDPMAVAQVGYATPRVVTARGAATPRGGVRISADQDEVETLHEGMSKVVMGSGRTTLGGQSQRR